MTSDAHELLLPGLDGSNPLAFLAALGTLATVRHSSPRARLAWKRHHGAWCAQLSDCEIEQEHFCKRLFDILKNLSLSHFEISRKWPFDAEDYRMSLLNVKSTLAHRRTADFFAAMGCEAINRDGTFADSRLRMVRAGDRGGSGFPVYAQRTQEAVTADILHRTLFAEWDYMDDALSRAGVPSFRWDPNEDSQHALQWGEPAKQPKKCMLGANRLALEALPFFPTIPDKSQLETTGFCRLNRAVYFTWPIWNTSLTPFAIRSLLSLEEVSKPLRY